MPEQKPLSEERLRAYLDRNIQTIQKRIDKPISIYGKTLDYGYRDAYATMLYALDNFPDLFR